MPAGGPQMSVVKNRLQKEKVMVLDGAENDKTAGDKFQMVEMDGKKPCDTHTAATRIIPLAQPLPEFQLQFDSNKAGLDSADANKTTAIIQEASKGSSYYINERRKAEIRQKHVLQLRQKSAQFAQYMSGEKNAACRRQWERKVSQIEQELEAGRHFRNYVHVDMDMFYAAVEMKKNPSLVDVPLGVGTFDMLSTTNYVARRYGVRSGMPGYIGVKLCPSLVIVPTDFDAYHAEAAVVRGIAAAYDPNFTSVGLDELTMEVTAYLQQHPGMTAGDVASEFRARVFAETQLTASAGIGPTATLAKIASNYEKPNGQHELRLRTRQDVMEFMKDLPVRTVPGIGRSTESILHGLGINLLGEIYDRRVELCYILTEKTFCFLLASSMGVVRWMDADTNDGSERTTEAERKSIGTERTFRNLSSRLELQQIAHSALQTAHRRLEENEFFCRQIVLKTKRASFQVHQYSKNLPQHSDDLETLRRGVDELLLRIADQYAFLRLVGVRLADIITKSEYEALQRGGMQRTLLQYCSRSYSNSRTASCGAKTPIKEEVKCKDENNGVEVLCCSANRDAMYDEEGDDDVVCVSPPVKLRRSEGNSSGGDDIIVID
ncbi:DNA polymerase kappa,DNA polymerase IV [Trypanosoma cruzi cruzi]|uniref:DNA polymerase kappa n=1 Tax=Trypanosoma cruzi TaxID=5693 RepID=A0A2V2VW88_TRYCR|nr:DNA polymerase kappa,DNA polymerase IV [Trypanosoma cruzi cruzi]PWV00666.1 putative DNA polymerase kappa [Trypanosoma cruzi]